MPSKPGNEPKPVKFHDYPLWCPRFWHGLRLGDWMRLATKNGLRIHPTRVPMAFFVCMLASFNSASAQVQRLRFGRRIDETQVDQPPLFVLGHWRSGTTLLHELMVLDERFAYPTTYQCFAPYHFLVTEWIVARYMGFLVPNRRPMDNMAAGWQLPQEDEFAVMTMGAPSPYLRMAFPNNPEVFTELYDMEDVDPETLEQWRQAIVEFVRLLTYHYNKRLVLKSPPHTGRVATLSRLFPGAKFVHIVRDPYTVYASTMRLWKTLDGVQGFQVPKHKDLRDRVFRTFEKMYAGFERQRAELDPNDLCDVRYEDLIADPVGQLRRVYEQLDLGGFSDVQPRIEQYQRDHQDYKTTPHNLDPETKAEVRRRWSDFIEKYGYSEQAANL